MIKLGFIGNKEMFDIFIEANKEDNNFELVFIDIKNDYYKKFDLDYVMVRATNLHANLVKQFVLNNLNINFIDNLERFTEIKSKYETSIERYKLGIGAKTFKDVDFFTPFPIVGKPIMGNKCKGIQYLHSYNEYLEWKKSVNLDEYFFQEKLNLCNEFRVLTFYINNTYKFFTVKKKTICGIKNNQKKLNPTKSLYKFIKENRPDKVGIIGYDIGQLQNGNFVIIEENRSPLFDRVQRRLNIDIPKELLNFIYKTHIKD